MMDAADVSIRFAQAQVQLRVLWRWWGCSSQLRVAWPQKWLDSGIASSADGGVCHGLTWGQSLQCSGISHKTLKAIVTFIAKPLKKHNTTGQQAIEKNGCVIRSCDVESAGLLSQIGKKAEMLVFLFFVVRWGSLAKGTPHHEQITLIEQITANLPSKSGSNQKWYHKVKCNKWIRTY